MLLSHIIWIHMHFIDSVCLFKQKNKHCVPERCVAWLLALQSDPKQRLYIETASGQFTIAVCVSYTVNNWTL